MESRSASSEIAALATVAVPDQESVAYTPLIHANVESAMHNVNSTAYIRVPFNVDQLDLNGLLLRMKHHDGFVAYLNGQQIASRNAPSQSSWNSTAVTSRSDLLATVDEEIDVGQYLHLLKTGDKRAGDSGADASRPATTTC